MKTSTKLLAKVIGVSPDDVLGSLITYARGLGLIAKEVIS
jgi:hypothetical protein